MDVKYAIFQEVHITNIKFLVDHVPQTTDAITYFGNTENCTPLSWNTLAFSMPCYSKELKLYIKNALNKYVKGEN